MRRTDKTIITCAITGGVHTPSMSPYLPISPAQIVEQAVDAANAGAAMIHLHARSPLDGRPSQDPELFMEFLPKIKAQTDAILNITTGGIGMSIDERLKPALRARPEVTSLNMGTMNFNFAAAAGRVAEFKFDWEEPFLRASDGYFMSNTFREIEYNIQSLAQFGTRFEFECYDVSHLYNLAYFLERGLVKPPLLVQCIFGVLGGIGADPTNLATMSTTADRLFGDDYLLSVLAVGRQQIPMATIGAIMGGNVRVGLEDSLFLNRRQLAKSNAEQVAHIRGILDQLGMDIASPAEARMIMQTKGQDQVAF